MGVPSPLRFLPRRLRPNRQRADGFSHGTQPQATPEEPPLGARAATLCAAIQRAAEDNLIALLELKPPVPLDPQPFGLLPARTAQVAQGHWWARLRAWIVAVARHLSGRGAGPALAHGGAADLFDPATRQGAAILLPAIIEQALGDATFRLRMAERCRRFLEERVLFHPDPPPMPLFSPGGAAMLMAAQPDQGRALGPSCRALEGAARQLRGPGFVLGFWDQWLLRRMRDAPGWKVPDGLPPLPWLTPDADGLAPDEGPRGLRNLMELAP